MLNKASETLRSMMVDASPEQWCRYIEMANKNFWTLQNNWMMNVERIYGQEAALQFDGLCYGRSIEVSAYRLLKFFRFGEDVLNTLVKVYQLSPAGSYINIQFQRRDDQTLVRRVSECPMQNVRLKQGQGPIQCKPALTIAATNIARAVSRDIEIAGVLCPPDDHPDDLWCEVVYSLKKQE